MALRAPDRRVSAWKVRAGRSVSSPWPESVTSFWRHALRLRGSSPPSTTPCWCRHPIPFSRLIIRLSPRSRSLPFPSESLDRTKFFLCPRSVPTAEDLVFFLR